MDRRRITIRHEADSTTIARVTCPTAPKFWRWRDIPFPKIVQRDVEFLEDEHDVDEWKPQLAAAVLCGVSGLAGFFLKDPSWSVGAYVVAYLAGSWFTAQEVWERLRQRAIDVHFLMLAVAAGSASIGAWGEGAMLLFLFSFSGALEHYAFGRTQKEIKSLFREAPDANAKRRWNGCAPACGSESCRALNFRWMRRSSRGALPRTNPILRAKPPRWRRGLVTCCWRAR
jgi:Cd2+/Zn2+-exporting ATPase